jgi:3-hydroxyisobutyrate dehydrogenase-like beta-hydroxyacid dehydrogenase
VIVGVLHPGAMGSAIGDALAAAGHDVVWASEGRSEATAARAGRLRDCGTVQRVAGEAELILSICPPHAALDVAEQASGFDGIYVDANAISPARAEQVAAFHPAFVDGGIIGGPPHAAGDTRLYLSGTRADEVASLFAPTIVDARVVPDASALKMTYAAWSKGTAALLLAIRDVARYYGVDGELAAEWAESQPDALELLPSAERAASAKGWRWAGEMDEIAATFEAAGAPAGFHQAAAEVYRS